MPLAGRENSVKCKKSLPVSPAGEFCGKDSVEELQMYSSSASETDEENHDEKLKISNNMVEDYAKEHGLKQQIDDIEASGKKDVKQPPDRLLLKELPGQTSLDWQWKEPQQLRLLLDKLDQLQLQCEIELKLQDNQNTVTLEYQSEDKDKNILLVCQRQLISEDSSENTKLEFPVEHQKLPKSGNPSENENLENLQEPQSSATPDDMSENQEVLHELLEPPMPYGVQVLLSSNNDENNERMKSNKCGLSLQKRQIQITRYKFDFPSDFSSKLIGSRGRNINIISRQSGATIQVRPKSLNEGIYSICIEGTYKGCSKSNETDFILK